MKSLLLVRHAKSGWDNPSLKDHERPLDERGHRDAPLMAKRLLDKGIAIDCFITSTALRALTTAQHFLEAYKADQDHLIEVPSLYHAEPPAFYEVIKHINDNYKTAVIFAHNPGITSMVNHLKVAHVDDMPTCAVFGVRADIENWADFKTAAKQFWFFDYPKLT